MPRTTKQDKRLFRKKSEQERDLKKPFRLNLESSYTSLLLGAAVVALVAIVLFFFSTNFHRIKKVDLSGSAIRSQLQQQLNKETKKVPKKDILTPTSTIAPTVSEAPTTAQQKLTGGEIYTVKEGDCLWTIALNTYGDGFRWVDIAQANNLSNPDLIFVDQKLTLPK